MVEQPVRTCTPVWYGQLQAEFIMAEAKRVGKTRAAFIRDIVSKHINSDPEAVARWLEFKKARET